MLNVDTRLLDGLNENEVFLLLHLAKRINKENICWPSNNTLMVDTGWHIEKIQKVKKSLEAKNMIAVQRSDKGKVNHYRIITNHIGCYVNGKSETPLSENPIPPPTGKSDAPLSENQVDSLSGNQVDPYRKIRQLSINKKVLSKEALTTEALTASPELIEDLPFKSDEFLNAWREWKQYKKERGQKLTPSTVKLQLKSLSETTEAEAIQVIKTSIEKGWTGLFQPKKSENSRFTNAKIEHSRGLAESFARRYGSNRKEEFARSIASKGGEADLLINV